MISKREFVKQWLRLDYKDRVKLSQTIKCPGGCTGRSTKIGWTFFLGTIAEMAVQHYLIDRKSTFELVDRGVIYQVGDRCPGLRGSCDINVWSKSRHGLVPTEIKRTSKILVDTFGQIKTIPSQLVSKAKQEGAQWLFVVDGLDYVESYSYVDEFDIDYSDCSLIFYDINTKEKVLVLDSEKFREHINKVLDI